MADLRVGQEKIIIGRQATGSDMKLRIGQEKIIIGRQATGSDMKLRVGQVKIIVGVRFSDYPTTSTTGDTFSMMTG